MPTRLNYLFRHRLPETLPLPLEVPMLLHPGAIAGAFRGERLWSTFDQRCQNRFQVIQSGPHKRDFSSLSTMAKHIGYGGKTAEPVDNNAAKREPFQAIAVIAAGNTLIDHNVRALLHCQ